MKFKIISFYTKNTVYENIIKNLITSLQEFNIQHTIYPIETTGSWAKNCQKKAEIILEEINKNECPFVYTDADSVIKKYPILFEELECDFAYHYIEQRKELLSGTMYFYPCENIKKLVERWIRINHTNKEWDQKNLQETLEKSDDLKLRTKILPASYCKIFDSVYQKNHEPIIEHYQASRKARRTMRP